jgi:hypothetical protein
MHAGPAVASATRCRCLPDGVRLQKRSCPPAITEACVTDRPNQAGASADAVLALDGIASAIVEGYLDLPLPAPADNLLAAFVERFAGADAAFRDALRQQLSLSHYDALLTFATRMAALAVRERSTHRLRLGAQAVALAGDSAAADWRETLFPLMTLSDAAARIGSNARAEFATAARLARGRTAEALISASRQSALRVAVERLAMRLGIGVWKVVDAPDGFRYVPSHRVSRAEADALVRRAQEARDNQLRNRPN